MKQSLARLARVHPGETQVEAQGEGSRWGGAALKRETQLERGRWEVAGLEVLPRRLGLRNSDEMRNGRQLPADPFRWALFSLVRRGHQKRSRERRPQRRRSAAGLSEMPQFGSQPAAGGSRSRSGIARQVQ